MKESVLKLRKPHILGLAILVLASVGVLLSTSDLAAQWTEEEMEYHRLLFNHEFSIDGQGDFATATAEEISAAVGDKYIDRNGLSTIPLRVVAMAGGGHTEGVGKTEYWLDESRPVQSMVRAKARGREFPAVHEMRFHLILKTEALPGRTFKTINPAVMVNSNATSFPPKLGARYELKQVVELEDVENPGVVVIRILDNKGEIVGSGRFGSLSPLKQ